MDLCEFEASLGYRANSSTGSKATEKPCLENQTKQNKTKQKNKEARSLKRARGWKGEKGRGWKCGNSILISKSKQ